MRIKGDHASFSKCSEAVEVKQAEKADVV